MPTGYGPTAARKHDRLGRETRPRTTTIDIHSHVSVPAAAAIVEQHNTKIRRLVRCRRWR